MTVAVRMLRVGLGALMLLIAVPLMVTGGGLWLLSEHRDHGAFTATLQRTSTGGRAIVVTDVDSLLRRDMPFARGGQTTLSVAARGPGGPLFLGLAKESDVRRYLAGTPHAEITRVRLARGPLPVDLTPAAVVAPRPAVLPLPGDQHFWLRVSTGLTRDGQVEDALVWSPSSVRGQHLAIVVMNADASAGVDVTLNARLTPAWVPATAGGLTIGGTALFLLGLLAAAWPTRRRRHDPDQFPLVPAEPLATDPAHPDELPSVSSDDDAAVPRPRVRGTADPIALPRRDGSAADPGPGSAIRPAFGADGEDPTAAPRPGDGAPEPVVEPQVTKETQPVAEDEPPQPARPEGPPLALPPVNLRLTWPALPGTRQKEDAKG